MNQDDFDKGQDRAYTELGKFNATFEYITYYLVDAIKLLLNEYGLKDHDLSTILLGGKTAGEINQLFQKISALYFEREDSAYIDILSRSFSNLIELRNKIVHCYWAVGVSTDTADDILLIGIKERIKKGNISLYNLNYDVDEMQSINTDLQAYEKLVYNLRTFIKEKKSIVELQEGEVVPDFKKHLQKIKSDPANIKFD